MPPSPAQSTGSHRVLTLAQLTESGVISPLAYAATLSAMRLSGELDERVAIALGLAQVSLKLGHLGLRLNAVAEDFSPEVLRELQERERAELFDDQLSIGANPLSESSSPLEDWSGLPQREDWLALLRESPAVWYTETPWQPRPFVLDGEVLFTLKAWRGEARVAQGIAALTRLDVGPIPQPQRLWDRLFGDSSLSWFDGGEVWDRSKLALYSAIRGAIMVIHGGPGTGKTTLTQRILAALIEQYHSGNDPLKIAITAPTGKAAQRLTESIQSRASFFHLPDEIQTQLGELRGLTLHSLLGIAPGRRPEHHAGNPLPYDVIVVDECSMVDLWLLQNLLDALPRTSARNDRRRLLLIGDPQQLPSVSAGAPFTELCGNRGREISHSRLEELSAFIERASSDELSSMTPTPTSPPTHQELLKRLGLSLNHKYVTPPTSKDFEPVLVEDLFVDHVAALNTVRRVSAESGIHAAATAIQEVDRRGVQSVIDCFKDPQFTDTEWVDAPPFPKVLFEEVMLHVRQSINLVKVDPQEALKHLKGLCLLSPHYGGLLGVNELNEAVEARLRDLRLGGWGRSYVGRPILVTQNHPPTGLVNGDIGLIGEGHWCHFEGRDKPIRLDQLPPHRTVYAMSIHKSQGSEFQTVIMCVPPERSPIMTRELIYTGLTRAKKRAVIVGSLDVLSASIIAQVERGGQLSARLQRHQRGERS